MDIVRNQPNGNGPLSTEPNRPQSNRAERVRATTPAVDVLEGEDALLVVVDMPGVTSEDLAIRLEKDELSIVGRRRDLAEPIEYRRLFAIPADVDGDAITAGLERGVLELRLPRKTSARPRQIPVKAS